MGFMIIKNSTTITPSRLGITTNMPVMVIVVGSGAGSRSVKNPSGTIVSQGSFAGKAGIDGSAGGGGAGGYQIGIFLNGGTGGDGGHVLSAGKDGTGNGGGGGGGSGDFSDKRAGGAGHNGGGNGGGGSTFATDGYAYLGEAGKGLVLLFW